MKKVVLFLIVVLMAHQLSCQSKLFSRKKTSPLDFSRSGGKTLDGYWHLYFETKDKFYLDEIIAYIETEDELLTKLNELCKENELADDWIEHLFLRNENGNWVSNYDTDFISVYFISNGKKEVSETMKNIYSFFSEDLLVRNAVKASAYWSLWSNAEEHEDVKTYLTKRLPKLSSKVRKSFSDVYNIE